MQTRDKAIEELRIKSEIISLVEQHRGLPAKLLLEYLNKWKLYPLKEYVMDLVSDGEIIEVEFTINNISDSIFFPIDTRIEVSK